MGHVFPVLCTSLNVLLSVRLEFYVAECQYYCSLLNILELSSGLQLSGKSLTLRSVPFKLSEGRSE